MNKEPQNGHQLPLQFHHFEPVTLTQYIAGPNQQAVDLINALLVNEITKPLYIWGKPSSGKSYLLQAACESASQQALTVAYVPLKIILQQPPQILDGLEQQQLICIDDINLIEGRADWQDALFHLYNRVMEQSCKLIISADQSPLNIRVQLPDLRSRLNWGVSVYLEELDDKDKIKLLQQKAAHRSFNLPDDVAEYLLQHETRDLNHLLALLTRIDESSLAQQRKVTIPFVKSLL